MTINLMRKIFREKICSHYISIGNLQVVQCFGFFHQSDKTIEYFQAVWNDLILWQNESMFTLVTEFICEGEVDILSSVHPIDWAATSQVYLNNFGTIKIKRLLLVIRLHSKLTNGISNVSNCVIGLVAFVDCFLWFVSNFLLHFKIGNDYYYDTVLKKISLKKKDSFLTMSSWFGAWSYVWP